MQTSNAERIEAELGAIALSQTDIQKARRARFRKNEFDELADSIREVGIVQPIVIRKVGKGFELVAGERRLEAAKLAGLTSIPATVRELTDEQALRIQLIENLQRVDVHPMQEAEGYQQLMRLGHPVEDLHTTVGKSRSYVYGRLKLLELSAKARKAFYADRISASVALLLARMPSARMQDDALGMVGGNEHRGPLSYRRASELIQDRYMLRLSAAPFSPKDETLTAAGACVNCPKRTGAQPELFGDVSSADVCTDPVCFAEKKRALYDRKAAEAKQAGEQVLEGAEARKVAPHGTRHITGKYRRLDDDEWTGKGWQRVSKIVGRNPESAVWLRDPQTAELVRIVPTAAINEALKGRGERVSSSSGVSEAAKKKKLDRAIDRETYQRARVKPIALDHRQLAIALFNRLSSDGVKELCRIRGFDAPKKKTTWNEYRDHEAIGKQIAGLDVAELNQWILDCIFAPELAHDYRRDRIKGLITLPELLKKQRISRAVVARELQPKKKKAAKKKAAKKRTAKKAPAKKRASRKPVAKKPARRARKKK